ncbi:PRMT5 arginine-N-methyltransferase-domain-containing protein [Amylocarpus encephaloides]|uniref:Protein arginine N-methyltransferase n=1 Tax=Amylocarpus encephaloides TaxID=45428 RepID=A0A9P7Y6K3_9HELO|nr:PRMT5 arginine-N-methyltransferase-domain-containing protein [Amylocarpus encephaloides]
MTSPALDPESPSLAEDFTPTFYIGHHESNRSLPVTDFVLRQAQDVGYDMVTSPITSPHFHSRVLTLVSAYFSDFSQADPTTSNLSPAPIIPPLDPVDTPLTPSDTLSQIIAHSSPWIDLCSPDPLIANISRQVLNIEIAYASFCGVGHIIIPGPRIYSSGTKENNGLIQYARAIQEALSIGSYLQMAIQIPMYGQEEAKDMTGDLMPFARQQDATTPKPLGNKSIDLFETWDAWNFIRSVCKYNSRLSIALGIPRQLPIESLQSRWFAEPLRLLSFTPSAFLKNKGGHPVLGKSHQSLLSRYMRLKQAPWLLLMDVGPIPGLDGPSQLTTTATSFPPAAAVEDVSRSVSASPTPAESADPMSKGSQKLKPKSKDPVAYLVYMRHLQRTQPPRTILEKFGSGYQDYLQAPLQPLTDNLESVTYEVFEKDPVKYDWYERAIAVALSEWTQQGRPTSSSTGAVVVAVAGSGRGPLVTRALRASQTTGVAIEVWAVEKNPNAYVLLQRHNEEDWGRVVNVVKSDMRAWKGPLTGREGNTTAPPSYGKVDIIVSELLGSFADNELSPECLDGVQHVLAPEFGISIPSSYTAHLTPILASRLHADISHRAMTDLTATETPYVVMLHAIDYLATSVPDRPCIQQAWEFVHPLPPATLAIAEARRSGGVSGGGGGSMAGGDGANEHNTRYSRLSFVCKDRGVVNGIAGYFEAVLYDGGDAGKVELSTRPDTIDAKSKDMISWFPIFFPLKKPLYFPDDSELEISIWRQTDDRKVWYEWLVEVFVMVDPEKRMRLGMSEVGSSRKVGCLM